MRGVCLEMDEAGRAAGEKLDTEGKSKEEKVVETSIRARRK
jgi:hypothetical protein